MPHRHQRFAPVHEYQPLRINAAAATPTPVGNGVNTTSATTIIAGSNVTVTPASMSNIFVGQKLNFANGTGTAETVVVKQTPSLTTFTADFVNGHSGAYTISSVSGTFLSKFIFMNAGTTMTLTLYNGNPNVLPLPSKSGIFLVIPTASVVLGQSQALEVTLDYGLFYTYTGTTAGDLTITFLDQPVA